MGGVASRRVFAAWRKQSTLFFKRRIGHEKARNLMGFAL